jgi:hypothetical protein
MSDDVYQPALVECVGPEHHRFTTAEDVRQIEHTVAQYDVAFYSIPHGSLDKVRCRECGHQVEPVLDEQGWALRP